MRNIISLQEERIKKAIKDATQSLIKARTYVAEGKSIPEDLIPRLEKVINSLEEQLRNYIENGTDGDDNDFT